MGPDVHPGGAGRSGETSGGQIVRRPVGDAQCLRRHHSQGEGHRRVARGIAEPALARTADDDTDEVVLRPAAPDARLHQLHADPASIISRLSIPALTLVVYVVVATIAGLLAASFPARRAARLDVLSAIAQE